MFWHCMVEVVGRTVGREAGHNETWPQHLVFKMGGARPMACKSRLWLQNLWPSVWWQQPCKEFVSLRYLVVNYCKGRFTCLFCFRLLLAMLACHTGAWMPSNFNVQSRLRTLSIVVIHCHFFTHWCFDICVTQSFTNICRCPILTQSAQGAMKASDHFFDLLKILFGHTAVAKTCFHLVGHCLDVCDLLREHV